MRTLKFVQSVAKSLMRRNAQDATGLFTLKGVHLKPTLDQSKVPDEFWAIYISYAEAARRLGCTRMNIHQMVKSGTYRPYAGRHPITRKPGLLLSYVQSILERRYGSA